MPAPQFESEQVNPILLRVYEGMTVYDQGGDKIGMVQYVYLGEVVEAPEDFGQEAQTSSTFTGATGSLIEEFAKAILLTERVSDIWRERLLSYGFIRINSTGLFTADRYAIPSQIASVVDHRVVLCVNRNELIKA
jgi:hypothetical protein